jgi:CheY-like chemotaxis protein
MVERCEPGSCVVGVVDDHADSRLVLRAILEPEFSVEEFDRGADALRKLQRRPPCVIVLDIAMPGLSGFGTLAMLKQDPVLRDVPVLAYTAFSNREESRRYREAGFGALIGKPIVDIDAVLAMIRDSACCPAQRSRPTPPLSRCATIANR